MNRAAMVVEVVRTRVIVMRAWGYMHAGAMKVEVLRKHVMGIRPWGYMHAGAMEVEAARGLSRDSGHEDQRMRGPWK